MGGYDYGFFVHEFCGQEKIGKKTQAVHMYRVKVFRHGKHFENTGRGLVVFEVKKSGSCHLYAAKIALVRQFLACIWALVKAQDLAVNAVFPQVEAQVLDKSLYAADAWVEVVCNVEYFHFTTDLSAPAARPSAKKKSRRKRNMGDTRATSGSLPSALKKKGREVTKLKK